MKYEKYEFKVGSMKEFDKSYLPGVPKFAQKSTEMKS